mgnify:CR=1 FL=1
MVVSDMILARDLRKKENLLAIENKAGYYKWWAGASEFEIILKELNVDLETIKSSVEIKDDLFCIYVGIAAKESVRDRLNWHVNDSHTASRVKKGTLSTFRQSISSLVAHNQYDKTATDSFIDRLYVEWFYSDNKIKSEAAKIELHDIERQLLNRHLMILNIQDNHHPLAVEIKKKLRYLRKLSKEQK